MAYSDSFSNSVPLSKWYLSPPEDKENVTPLRQAMPTDRAIHSSCHWSKSVPRKVSTCLVPTFEQAGNASTSSSFADGVFVRNSPLRSRLFRQYYSPSSIPVHRPKLEPDLLYKMKCKELLNTEESYLSQLYVITDVFMGHMERRNVVQARDFRLLFPAQLEQLIEIHTTLLHHLTSEVNSTNYSSIGSVFVHLLSDTEVNLSGVYGAYMNSFQVSCQVQERYMYDSYYQRVYQDCLANPKCKGLDLLAYLLTPVQRLPRYKLLLSELLHIQPTIDPQLKTAMELVERELGMLNSAIILATKFTTRTTPHSRKFQRVKRQKRVKSSYPRKRWSGSVASTIPSDSTLSSTMTQSSEDLLNSESSVSQITPLKSATKKHGIMYSSTPLLNEMDEAVGTPSSLKAMEIMDISNLSVKTTQKKPKKVTKLFRKLFHK